MDKAQTVAGMLAGELVRQSLKTTVDTYGGEFDDHIRADFWTDIYEAVYDYLNSTGSVTQHRNRARRAIVNWFSPAMYSGFADAGAEETEDEDERWLTAEINRQLAFIDDTFAALRDKRGNVDADAEASARADGYRGTLDNVYTEGKLRGSKNKTLEFDGDDGEESCPTCQRLKGTRRSIKWILANDARPYPGNEYFDCKGYKCQHYWKDPKTGERFTF